MNAKLTRAQLLDELVVEQFASYGHNEWKQPARAQIEIPVYVDEMDDGPDADVIELWPRRVA